MSVQHDLKTGLKAFCAVLLNNVLWGKSGTSLYPYLVGLSVRPVNDILSIFSLVVPRCLGAFGSLSLYLLLPSPHENMD